jgi:hypothetical protein
MKGPFFLLKSFSVEGIFHRQGLGSSIQPKKGFITANYKRAGQRQSLGFIYSAQKVSSIQISVWPQQTSVYYISIIIFIILEPAVFSIIIFFSKLLEWFSHFFYRLFI